MNNRYLTVPAFKTKGDVVVPLWDAGIKYIPAETDFSDSIYHKVHCGQLQRITAIYDLQEKKLTTGVPVEIFAEDQCQFAVGETVYYDKTYRVLAESTIVTISKGICKVKIEFGKDIEKYWSQYMDKVQPDTLYCLTVYTPQYTLANGVIIEWEHQLYKKEV